MAASKEKVVKMNARDAFFKTQNVPKYQVHEIELESGAIIEFEAREFNTKEYIEFSNVSKSMENDIIKNLLWLNKKGLVRNTDGTPMFEETDKDSMYDASINEVVTAIMTYYMHEIINKQAERVTEKN